MDERLEGTTLILHAVEAVLADMRAGGRPVDAEQMSMLEELRRRLLEEQGEVAQ